MDLICPKCEDENEDEEELETYADERELIDHYVSTHVRKVRIKQFTILTLTPYRVETRKAY